MPKKQHEVINFEKSLQELTEIIEQMESGSLNLEDSLIKFEQGIKLTRECQKSLSEAEQKVKILVGDSNQATLADFTDADNGEE